MHRRSLVAKYTTVVLQVPLQPSQYIPVFINIGSEPIGLKPIHPVPSHHGPAMSLVLQVSDLDIPCPPVYSVWLLSEYLPAILRLGTAFLRVRIDRNHGLFLGFSHPSQTHPRFSSGLNSNHSRTRSQPGRNQMLV